MLQINAASCAGLIGPADPRSLITERVRGEYRAMPGLSLTLAQAGRLWSLDTQICAEVLGQLVDAGFLRRKADGAFCRSSDFSRNN